MKYIISSVFVALGLMAPYSSVQAQELEKWEQNLVDYQARVLTLTNVGLQLNRAYQATATIGSCAVSGALVAVEFIADTTPIINGLAEGLPNLVKKDYVSVTTDKVLSQNTLDLIARGALGGLGLALYESLEFIPLLLQGETERAYEATAKMYESTRTTAKAFFAKKSLCLMSASKFYIAHAELARRAAQGIDIKIEDVEMDYSSPLLIMP